MTTASLSPAVSERQETNSQNHFLRETHLNSILSRVPPKNFTLVPKTEHHLWFSENRNDFYNILNTPLFVPA
jgi:hypothetical protein